MLINSEGGSVLYGMSTFSIIHSCPIEVDCVIEGIAASMGSIVWTAGTNLYMHDYSLLMVHNPFGAVCKDDAGNVDQSVKAFRCQLETIYQKRFGLTKQQVRDIMDGKENEDGTYFTAQEAVKAGFLPADHIIKTSKTIRDKVKSQINGVDDVITLRDTMSSISAEIDEDKLFTKITAINNRDSNNLQFHKNITKTMDEQALQFISAQLGFSADTQVDVVKGRIAELVNAENSLKDCQNKFVALEIKAKGTEAELTNTKSELEKVQASLKKYQDAEIAAHEAEINALVEDAINAGKIENSAKESWVNLAHNDFETVKATLDSIKGRDNILQVIATDPANVGEIQNGIVSTEKELEAKIKSVCGETFALRKF